MYVLHKLGEALLVLLTDAFTALRTDLVCSTMHVTSPDAYRA